MWRERISCLLPLQRAGALLAVSLEQQSVQSLWTRVVADAGRSQEREPVLHTHELQGASTGLCAVSTMDSGDCVEGGDDE